MSGVALAAGAFSLVSNAYGAYEANKTATKTANLEQDQIRQQQTQLRLQQNQAELERIRTLQKTLATQEVTFGSRNIAPSSGTVAAFTEQSMAEFYADENADKLNYGSKQLALATQSSIIKEQEKAQKISAITGFVNSATNVFKPFYSSPSATTSLLDFSKSPFDLNA